MNTTRKPVMSSLPATPEIRLAYRREADRRGMRMMSFVEYLLDVLHVCSPEHREAARRRYEERASKRAIRGTEPEAYTAKSGRVA
jgi:hypothetical protein